MSSPPIDLELTRSLPKIELHAHLTGSITPQTLHEIWLQQTPTTNQPPPLPDPLQTLSPSKTWDIKTFFPLFSTYIYALLSTKASLIYSTNAVLNNFLHDGVVYLELRTTPRSSSSFSKEEYIETILHCITSFPAREKMPTYLILSIDRRDTPAQAMATVELALMYCERGVVGVDLCGDPSKGDVSTFSAAFAKARARGLKLTVHFAEVVASSSRGELELLLGFYPERLGHVIHVPGDLRGVVLERGIGVELCVSCNVQAKLTSGGVQDHHFGWWWDSGGRVVLCTDDVGIFGSTLSNEYLLVAQHFNLSRKDLLDLCGRGIETIFGGEDEKVRLRKLMQKAEEECSRD